MNDRTAIERISRLVVETAESLRELQQAAGRTEASGAEVEEAAYFGALERGATSEDLNEKLVAVLTEMLEELVAAKVATLMRASE